MKKFFLFSALALGAMTMSAQIEDYVPTTKSLAEEVSESPVSCLPKYDDSILYQRPICNLVGQKLYFTSRRIKDRGEWLTSNKSYVAFVLKIDDVNKTVEYDNLEKGYYEVIDQILTEEEAENWKAEVASYTALKKDLTFYQAETNITYPIKIKKTDYYFNFFVALPSKSQFLQKIKNSETIYSSYYIIKDEKGFQYIIGEAPCVNKFSMPSPIIGEFIPVLAYENVKSFVLNKVFYFPDRKYYTCKKISAGLGNIQADFEGEDGIITKPIYYYGKTYFRDFINEYLCDFKDIDGIIIDNKHDKNTAYNKYSLDSAFYVLKTEIDAQDAAKREAKERKNAEYIKKYGEKFGSKVVAHEIVVGMNKEMCKAAKGAPENARVLAGGVDVWIYTFDYQYTHGLMPVIQVTFKDGKVTDVLKLAEIPY